MIEILANNAEGVLTLTLNRPAKMNALTRAMYAELSRCLQVAAGDSSTRVVLIRAEGENFTAGNDIQDFIAAEGTVSESEGFKFLLELHNFPKPIVAVVQGAAIGIGTTMLLHCDAVLATPTATFSMPFVSLGLVPEAGSSYLFPQLVGYQRASQIFLTGENFGADVAKEFGLVMTVSDTADAESREMARKIARQPPTAVINTKALLKSRTQDSVTAVMNAEAQLFTMALQSDEAMEAFMKFSSRRESK